MINKNEKNKLVLHMPHTSVHIPDHTGYRATDATLKTEIDRVTDWGVAEIFDIDNVTKVVADFSRLFCDVERFYDEGEPLSTRGFGITYTRLENGDVLRELTAAQKNEIISNYYEPHHEQFTNAVCEKLSGLGEAIIIDCHSFPDNPLAWEDPSDLPRPDICIGTDAFHTPPEISKLFTDYFEEKGYTVSINHPFAGTIVPSEFYHKVPRVHSIMIEINRRLFMDNENIPKMNQTKILQLKKEITELLIEEVLKL
jgi:N-formylglutamate amidohydrolase